MIDRDSRNASEVMKNVRGDALVYRTVLDQLRGQVPFAEALVITSLPRGGLQIAQPQKVSEVLFKAYVREFNEEDRLTWQVIIRREPLRGTDAWGQKQFESSRFLNEFLAGNNLRHAIAAPLSAPVIDGYPGALHLYREADQGPFSDADLRHLRQFAGELDAAILKVRTARPVGGPKNTVLRHLAPASIFIFDQQLRPLFAGDQFAKLDERLRQGMLDHAKQRFAQLKGDGIISDRVPIPDSRGDLWNFRVVVYSDYPALGEGPVIFFCLQPETEQWAALRAADFQADAELVRLVPSLKYMRDHFAKSPKLPGIAKTVHLSPFHFHRRFTELLGITPKQFLSDCQIEEAKEKLFAREEELADIASKCGFAHQSHFTSRFKQATGLTPTRWRKLALVVHGPSSN